jgi:CheY-like chemotaxis protein
MRQEERLRTVVVDDDATNRSSLCAALERSGRFTVVGQAADGGQAVQRTRAARADVVLLSPRLPDIDGFAAVPHLREACQGGTVVVASSTRVLEVTGAGVGHGAPLPPTSAAHDRLVEDLLGIVRDTASGTDDDVDRWRLPAALASGAQVRARLRGLARRWPLGHVMDELQLLTSELVNNAVVHAQSGVLVTVRRHRGAIRVEVTDWGLGTPRPANAPTASTATSGRGLRLIDAMASGWGAAIDDVRTTTWFELSLHRAAGSAWDAAGALDPAGVRQAVQAGVQRLLRVRTPVEAISVLVGLVHELGGWTVPAGTDDAGVLQLDLSLGVLSEPLHPAAEPDSPARHHLEMHLPGLLDDARMLVAQLGPPSG